MITVVSESTGYPLGTLKRGKPRVGDSIFIDDAEYEVTERDRDSVTVRQAGAFSYRPNPPVSRMSGYKRNLPYDKDLPFKKYEQGPIYPPDVAHTSYSVPSSVPYPPQVPHWAPGPFSGQGVPFQQPYVYTVVHHKYHIPIYKMETYRAPIPGERLAFGGENYTIAAVDGATVFAKPDRNWNYAVIAIDKESGEAIYFLPAEHRYQISNTKYRLKHFLKKSKGIERRDYHLTYKEFRKIRKYMRNPKVLPKYTR